MKLNWTKIEEFEKDILRTSNWGELKKWLEIWRHPAGYLGWFHLLYTLKAHARGRIHTKHIGKQCKYAPGMPRTKGSGIFYKRIEKTYKWNILTLEDQERFLGKDFLDKFILADYTVSDEHGTSLQQQDGQLVNTIGIL